MKRLAILTAGLAAAAVVVAVAQAKGPSQATITGPGLTQPIVLRGDSENGEASPFAQLVEAAGFFPVVYARSPDPTLRHRPAGTLGARYLIVYRVPGPNGALGTIRQELYPFAKPLPLSYTRPGQKFWNGKTHGGWIQASSTLREVLVSLGIPAPK